MARGRNAPALFDVIHAAKRPPKASPTGGGVPTPRWWARGGKSADRPADAPHGTSTDDGEDPTPTPEPSGGTRRSWLAAARQAAGPGPSAEHQPEADDRPESPVVITRFYPPDADLTAADPEPADADGTDVEDGDGEEPVFSRPPVEATAVAAPPRRPAWIERPARGPAERPAGNAPGRSDPAFDPTADVTAADLRPTPRASRWADEDDVPPAHRLPRSRRSAGPTPSAMKPAIDPAVSLDRAAGEVRVRLSYAGAILAAMILLLVLVIAYLAGTTRSGTAAEATAVDPPAAADPRPAAASGMMAAVSTDRPAAAPEPPPAAPATAATPEPAAPVQPAARQVGLMYVVMQSYPDRDMARQACDFLNHAGVPCDVVLSPSGVALREWYSVVGLQSFPRSAHGPAMQAYLKQLTALGPKFSGTAYNQFQPQPYTWRSDSATPRP